MQSDPDTLKQARRDMEWLHSIMSCARKTGASYPVTVDGRKRMAQAEQAAKTFSDAIAALRVSDAEAFIARIKKGGRHVE